MNFSSEARRSRAKRVGNISRSGDRESARIYGTVNPNDFSRFNLIYQYDSQSLSATSGWPIDVMPNQRLLVGQPNGVLPSKGFDGTTLDSSVDYSASPSVNRLPGSSFHDVAYDALTGKG
jgi:hypothetical protein